MNRFLNQSPNLRASIEKDLQKDTTERTGWIKSKNSLKVKAEPRSNTT